MSMYVKLDVDFLGIMVPKVGVLITQEPSEVLNECHKTKLAGVISWNMIKLAYQVFIQKYGIKSLIIVTAQQVFVHCCFPSFVYFTITKQAESSQTYSHQYHWAGTVA